MVKRLPATTTVDDVLQHFNSLYDLSKPDWTFAVRDFCCFQLRHTVA